MENEQQNSEKKNKKGFWKIIGAFFVKYRYFFSKIGISLLTLALSTILLFFILRKIPVKVRSLDLAFQTIYLNYLDLKVLVVHLKILVV